MSDRLDVMPVVLTMSDAIGIWIECFKYDDWILVGMFVRWPGGVYIPGNIPRREISLCVCVCVCVWLPAVDL